MKKEVGSLERRDFFKGAAVGAAGLAAFGLAGCAENAAGNTAEAETTDALTWDREVDVVVVGSGGSGLSAAVAASAEGANTLVLEKNGWMGGTTYLSAAITQAAGTTFQKELTEYQDDTPEKHFEFYMKLGEGWVDEELVRDLAYGAPDVIQWYIDDLGLTIPAMSGQSHVPYAEDTYAIRIHRPDGEGPGLIGAMQKLAESQGAVIELDSEVTKLIVDADGVVAGVEVTTEDGVSTVKANKGVVLATSNIDHNEEMAKQFCPQQVWAMSLADVLCCPTNTGDGIRMGMEIGADITNFGSGMDAILDLKLTSGQPIWGLLFVNKAGSRYVCEDAHYAYKTRMQFQMEKSTDHPCYAVWGESNLENCRPWDATTIQDAINEGIVISASSIEELAAAIGVNASGLQNTINHWNEGAAVTGVDEEYGRISGFEKIEGPTYYANRMRPEIMGPCGGLKIDVETHVLRPDGSPIPHLYAAGLCTGGWVGPFYPGSGTAMASNGHFGRKAGRNAAKSA